MARIFSSGFELGVIAASSNTFGEYDAAQTNGGPSNFDPGAISTTIKRSGTSSLRVNGSIPAGTNGRGVIQDTHTGTSNRKMWLRTYVRFESFPSAISSVFAIGDPDLSTSVVATVNSSGQIQYYSFNNGTGNYDAIGSLSSALNLSQWYRIEISLDTTTPTSWSGELRIDESTISTMSGQNGGDQPCASIHFFAASLTGAAISGLDQYYDDIACNDASGSDNTSWPGAGSIFHMYPDAAGDSNQWATEAGAASSNNFQKVDEQSPDNQTTYVKRTATGTLTDDYNLQTSASAGIGAADTVRLVQVGCRVGATSNTPSTRAALLRIKGQSGGTVQSSPSLNWAVNAWCNHFAFNSSAPFIGGPYGLTATTNPQNGAAWTTATLDTMQIGLQNVTSSLNEIRCSTIWALVEVVPVGIFQGVSPQSLDFEVIVSTKQNAGTAPKLPLSSSLSVNTIQYYSASAQLNEASVLSTNTLWFPVAQQVIPCSSDLSVDTLVFRRGAAVLPGTSSFTADAIPKFTVNIMMFPTSSLSAVGKQWWTSVSALSPDSNVIANVTRQNVGVFATFPIASDLSLNLVFQYKISAVLPATSSLQAFGGQWWRDTAAFIPTSSLSSDTSLLWGGKAVLAATSSFIQSQTIQTFEVNATLGLSSNIIASATGKFQQALAGLAASSSMSANALVYIKALASLRLDSDLSANTDRYMLANASLNIVSSLTAGTDRYINAVAVLPCDSSLLLNNIKFKYAITAELDCSSNLIGATFQLFLQQATAELDCSSSLFVNTKRYIPVGVNEFPLASDFRIAFTPLLRPASSVVMSGDTTLSVTTAIKDRNVSVVLFGTSSLSVNSVFQFKLQSSYALSSDLSLAALQRWNSRSTISLSSSLQSIITHKMLDTASFALVSSLSSKAILFKRATSKMDCVSSLRANIIIHEIENHAKTQKHLRGNINVRHLKAGMAEEVLDDGVIH